MNTRELQRLGDYLSELFELAPLEREDLLAILAVRRPELARRLRRRLERDRRALPRILERIAETPPPSPRPRLKPGDSLGPYRIVRQLGEGGMGEVYLADRVREFEQRVALKRIRSDIASAEFARRFADERRLLARLEHPNIARILDGGSTPEGDPYFVMEYVDGQPIDRYCDSSGASTRRRVELVLQLCEAVLASHLRLVIHRDLKPTNVLVTQGGVVKLLDFGIAKLVHRGLTRDERTQHRPLLTPSWASPEYLAGESVDVRSDVYSLGVLLYWLLTGDLPHDLRDLGYPEMFVRLREVPVEAPSRVLDAAEDEVVRQRRISPDLDAIVLRALRFERWGRYPSVEALANDLRAELESRPVAAMGEARRYRWGKLARRYRRPLIVAAIFFALGILFAVTVTLLWRQAVEARDEARSAQVRAERASLREERGRLRTSAVLDALLDGLEARRWFDHPRPAVVLTEIGQVLYRGKGYDHAEQVLEEALEYRDTLPLEDRWILDSNLATILAHRGEYDRAEALYEQVLRHRRSELGADHPKVGNTLLSYGVLEYARADLVAAEQRFREARVVLGETGEKPDLLRAALDLSQALVRISEGRPGEAETLLGSALVALGDGEHPSLRASIEMAHAQILIARGDPRAAEVRLRGLLDALQEGSLLLEWRIAQVESVLGECLADQGRFDEAEILLFDGWRILREERGSSSIYAREARRRLTEFARLTGRTIDAP